MRINADSYWDSPLRYDYMENFICEIEALDKAHKRAKRELRKQQKALSKKNDIISSYRESSDYLLEENIRLEKESSSLLDDILNEVESKCDLFMENIELTDKIATLSLKITCLEQENKTLRKQQTNQEKEVQERIIQAMNDIIVELRTQLNETEEKYNELLKHVIDEK